MRRTQSFADVKVHCCLSLKVAYLSQRVTLKDPDFQTRTTKRQAITVPQQSWGINGEVLTEMPLSKTAWKCHNVIRVFVICGHFIQAWQHIWENLGKHLDLSFLQQWSTSVQCLPLYTPKSLSLFIVSSVVRLHISKCALTLLPSTKVCKNTAQYCVYMKKWFFTVVVRVHVLNYIQLCCVLELMEMYKKFGNFLSEISQFFYWYYNVPCSYLESLYSMW